MKSLSQYILVSLVSLGTCLIFLEFVFRFLPVASSTKMRKDTNRALLTHFEPNRTITFSTRWNFDFNIEHQVNNYGFINKRNYKPSPDMPPIAVIGDSFVEAFQVPYGNSFHGMLSQHLNNQCEVYTFASSDAPLSQYLKWAEFARKEFNPQLYIFTIVSNDFYESDVYYGIKPLMNQFVMVGDKYQFVPIMYEPSLLKRLARESALVRYLVLNLKISSLKNLHDTIQWPFRQRTK